MYNWRKGIAGWKVKGKLFLSIVFTWDLPAAKMICENTKGPVLVGGPAVSLMPDYLSGVAKIGHSTDYPALAFHNPMATFTTRGCTNSCSFCAVPKTEGAFVELESWDPRPLVCDNNLLAASWKHFERVIDSLKRFPFVDFQGLEAHLFNEDHARKFSELNSCKLSFAFDSINQERQITRAVKLALKHGLKDIRVYVLLGHDDNSDDGFYRLETVRSWGKTVLPFPQRFQPLYALKKNDFLSEKWTEVEMRKMIKYYSRLNYYGHVPYDEFKYTADDKAGIEQELLF